MKPDEIESYAADAGSIGLSEVKDSMDEPQAFEDIIDDIGGFGYWQRMIFFIICLTDIFGSLALMLPVIAGATPRWYCVDQTPPTGSDDNTSAVNVTWNKCVVNASFCSAFKFHDDFTSIVSQWNLVCDKKYVSDTITSIQMSGLFLGAIIGGQSSDLYGRKIPYFLSVVVLITSGMMSAFTPNWQLYAACRFLVGVGYGSQQVINCVYPLEFVGRRWRSLCGTVGFWAVGQMSLAALAYGIRNWRHLVIATSVPGYLYIFTWWLLPESPRWLTQKRRFTEAHAILRKIARKNNKPCPDITVIAKFCDLEEARERTGKKCSYLDIVNNWHYRKITLISMLAWFATCLIYYQLSFNVRNLSGNRYVNMTIAGIVDFFSMLLVIPACNILGRRLSYLLFIVIAMVGSTTIMAIFITDSENNMAREVTVMAQVGKGAALGGLYVCQIYSAELFPTVVRNLGVGAGTVAGRVGTVLGPQMVLLGIYHSTLPFILSSLVCLIVSPFIFLLPETKGRPLEDHM